MDIKKEFIKRFGNADAPIRIFAAPGRVNLIGEHIDYNGGCVFPAAIDMGTFLAVRQRSDNKIILAATDLEDTVEADIDNLDLYKDIPWGNYQLGVISELKKAGYDICGAEMLFHDTIPHGGGLSSSAAIEISTALCFATFSNEKNGKGAVDMKEMALIGQRAENNYIGVSCGIMDQFASAMGKAEHAVFLNCQTLSYELVPLVLKNKKIVITNTNKKHSLKTSAYNERRSQCDAALGILKEYTNANFLCEISVSDFEKYKDKITDSVIRKRAQHAVYEMERTRASVTALKNGDIEKFGQLMNESHDSLRDLYEVTGIELDTLAKAAREVDGCLGSRMTGAGFGGCTVSIVNSDAVDKFKEHVAKVYTEKTGITPSFYVTNTGDGGREIKEGD